MSGGDIEFGGNQQYGNHGGYVGPGMNAGGGGMNGGGNGMSQNGQMAGSNQETSSNGQPEYTLAGILHYLQSEWRRYERDRNEWEIERAEMRVSTELPWQLSRRGRAR